MDRNVVFIALFAALIAALGLIPQLMLVSGVPITAQSLGVMLCGTILGSKRGALAVLLFLVLMLLGLPLLAGARGGIGLLATPSVGFLMGWPIAAFVTGLMVERVRFAPVAVVAGVASVVGGILVLYTFGIIGMSLNMDISLLKAAGFAGIYIPGDIVKAVVAGLLTAALLKARPHSVLSRAPHKA